MTADVEAQVRAAIPASPAEGVVYTPAHLLDALHRQLALFSRELAAALEMPALTTVQPVIAFAEANLHAQQLERADAGAMALRALVLAHGGGEVKALAFDQPTPGDSAFTMPVCRRLDGRPVGAIHWPQARYEPPADALVQLIAFAHAQGLSELDMAAGRTMH